jgi:phage-related protein
MPNIGSACHELRIADGNVGWRIVYYIAADAIVVLEVFAKKTPATPTQVMVDCRKRLAAFQKAVEHKKGARRARR